MIELEKMGEMLDEIALTLPREIYEELNGGISLLPDAKVHPEARRGDLYILGEYHRDPAMGRYITIYGGSFQKLFPDATDEQLYAELEKTLKHEFVHHIESLAGEKDLEVDDERRMAEYRARWR